MGLMGTSGQRQQALDAIQALVDEIARLAPDCADKAMQISRLVRELDPAPDSATIADAISAQTADSDLSDATGACSGKKRRGVRSQGVELEANFYPSRTVTVDLGLTYAETQYRDDLSGAGGRPLPSALFLLPGSTLSNAPKYTATGGATWTPPLNASGVSALLHLDARYQSRINTGSDLLPEKLQNGVAVINGRIGVTGPNGAWGVELWSQNLFDKDYRQVVASAPLQGSGSLATVAAGGASPGNSLFIVFPAEPRTFGVTVRTKF